ncbi:hypothetical protein QE374_002778 [Microbacterium sp. SORGH_AS428]|uniref:hypothetical protein n=1 Tax=Microbacterium sp. SORGH_AS_0428 TaxID=3041788 RepID=UPI0028588702|nr:hypothetical protein [Microbacterium sp. SORGH_AS_0428]MDR6200869.1 hypothetical protein [Microbacterium sp. SORGH_AS_0428]
MTQQHPVTADVYFDLALLRKNEGFVAHRLDRVDTVAELLQGDTTDSFDRLRHRFVSAIHALPAADAELLLDIFALSPETEGVPRLQERRRIHGKKIERRIDTVANREPAALNQLASRLIRGTYPQSPLRLDVPEMHNGIIYETISTRIIVENRIWTKTYEHYRFVLTIDELDWVNVVRSYDGTVFPDPDGAFKVNTRPITGAGWNDYFWHLNTARTATEPMRRGETYDLRFAIRPPSSTTNNPLTLASRAFHERALLAIIEVQFIGDIPDTIWKYSQLSPFARPTEANEYNSATADHNGIVTLRGRDLHGGLFSGIAWTWDQG